MNISGLTLDDFTACVNLVSGSLYSGNIAVSPDAYDLNRVRKPACVARLTAADGYGKGARTSWTGRHGRYACWHAYRDVLNAVFRWNPDAVIRTQLATYRGETGFRRDYPETAHQNIGSQMSPAYMPELCACDDSGAHPMERMPRSRAAGVSTTVEAARASMSRIERELAAWYESQGYTRGDAVMRVRRERN